METLDIHGVNADGNETVIIHNVSLLMILSTSFSDRSLSLISFTPRQAYVRTVLLLSFGWKNKIRIRPFVVLRWA